MSAETVRASLFQSAAELQWFVSLSWNLGLLYSSLADLRRVGVVARLQRRAASTGGACTASASTWRPRPSCCARCPAHCCSPSPASCRKCHRVRHKTLHRVLLGTTLAHTSSPPAASERPPPHLPPPSPASSLSSPACACAPRSSLPSSSSSSCTCWWPLSRDPGWTARRSGHAVWCFCCTAVRAPTTTCSSSTAWCCSSQPSITYTQ